MSYTAYYLGNNVNEVAQVDLASESFPSAAREADQFNIAGRLVIGLREDYREVKNGVLVPASEEDITRIEATILTSAYDSLESLDPWSIDEVEAV